MDPKTKEIVNNIINYVIGKDASDEIKKNQHSVTKALALSADNLCLESIRKDLWEHILDRTKYFNRDDLLFLAEFMRESFSARLYPVALLYQFATINDIGIYISKIVLGNGLLFNNRSCMNLSKLKYLIDCIIFYDNVKTKIEYTKRNTLSVSIDDIFEPVKNEVVDNYFQGYTLYLNSIKVEDIEIKNPELRQYLTDLHLTPNEIYKQANPVIEDIIGFNYDDVNFLINMIPHIMLNTSYSSDKENRYHIKMKKNDFIDYFKDYISEEHLINVLKYLSINHCLNDGKHNNREVELRCITENDGVLSFAIRTILECLGIFKRITITGHYMDEVTYSYQKTKLELHSTDLIKQQQSMSTYFSYVVAELFETYGYLIAKGSNGYPAVDIKDITVNGLRLVFNDIDVLAFNKNTNTIINCELKYCKVKMDYAGMTKDALDKEKYESLLKRETTLKNNKSAIVKEMFGLSIPDSSIEVKSIVVTSRQNYNKKSITEYNFEIFKRKLINKEEL